MKTVTSEKVARERVDDTIVAVEIFHETLRRMGIGPDQAIFVGDTPEADVLGPQGVGMDAIWINRGNASMPPGAAPPVHTVARFAEVAGLL